MEKKMQAIDLRTQFGTPAWGPIGADVYGRTYSRTLINGSKEDYANTVERTVLGNIELVSKRYLERGEADKLMELFYQFYSMPAGRHLWASGVPGRQFLFNCHHSGWTKDLSTHCAFTFDELMKGGGTGTNFSHRYISNISKVRAPVSLHIICDPSHKDYDKFKHLLSKEVSYEYTGGLRIEDSREGWVDGLVAPINSAMGGDTDPVIIDVTLVRAEGEPIKGFGGTASGPKPLIELLHKVVKLLNDHVGEKLSTMPLMYLEHFMAECVIAGNVRRSARMSIVHWQDADIFKFINCKQDDKDLWSTNISVEYDNAFIRALKHGDAHAKTVMDAVVKGMLTNGEPGLWNYSLSQKGEIDEVSCTNPCFAPETRIVTRKGVFEIKDLVGLEVEVLSQGKWVKIDNFRVTGENQKILKVTLQDGSSVRVTPYHQFILEDGRRVEARDLKLMDRLQKATNQPDGKTKCSGYKQIINISKRLEGLLRHASIHAAGVIITSDPLVQYCPLYRGKEGERVVQFDKDFSEKIGLVKFDFLGLRTLTIIDWAINIINNQLFITASVFRRTHMFDFAFGFNVFIFLCKQVTCQ